MGKLDCPWVDFRDKPHPSPVTPIHAAHQSGRVKASAKRENGNCIKCQ